MKQVMGAGAIPVFIAWDMVPPFPEIFDWPSFSLAFTPDQVGPEMIETLRAISPEKLKTMQVSDHRVWCLTNQHPQLLHPSTSGRSSSGLAGMFHNSKESIAPAAGSA